MGKHDAQIAAHYNKIAKYGKQKKLLKTAKKNLENNRDDFQDSKDKDDKTIKNISHWKGPIFDRFCNVSGNMLSGEALYHDNSLQDSIDMIQKKIEELDDDIDYENTCIRILQRSE